MERREASASRWTRAAPQSARTVARPQRATTEILRLSALRSPLMGADGKEKSKTRAQQRAAGTKKTALFDIVNRNIAATRSVPAERATSRALPTILSCPGQARASAPIFARGVGPRARAGTQGHATCCFGLDIALRASCPGSRVSFRFAPLARDTRAWCVGGDTTTALLDPAPPAPVPRCASA